MVQTFGKRIIGGIGAPGGGMSKAYAEGVNTGIAQRADRQAMEDVSQQMRIREQDQAFKIEDREEAKRQRAAAAANAAAARARNIATARAVAAAGGTGGVGGAGQYFRLNTRGAPTTRPGALSMGTTAPAAPAAAPAAARTSAAATPTAGGATAPATRQVAGLNTYDNMNISNIVDVQGTYDRPSTLQQRRAAAAANTRAGLRTGLPPEAMTAPVLATMAARPGDFAAQAAQRDLAARQAAIAAPGAPLTPREAAFQKQFNRGMGSLNIPALQQYRQELEDRIAAETQAKATGDSRWWWQEEDLNKLIAEKQLVDAEIAAVQSQPSRAGLQTRGTTAEEGPGSTAVGIAAREAFVGPPVAPLVTIQGPNGPISVPAEPLDYANVVTPPIMPPGALPAGRMDIPVPASPELSFGGAASPQTSMAGGTTYGGQLGAAPTPTEMFFADMGYTPAGQVDIQALMADQSGPIMDPAFSQIAEQERVRYIYEAEDALARGDTAGYIAAQNQIKTQEMLILAQQVVAGADEALRYDSTERLNMAASMIEGVDIVFIPKGEGTVDVYVNGQLDDENIPIQSIVDQLRMRVDTKYVEQMGAVAAEEQDIEREIRKQTAIETAKSDLTSERLVLANDLAKELAEAGKFDEVTVELMRESLIRQGLLPADTPELKIQTNSITGGFVVINPQTGAPVTQYVPNPNGDGSLVEQR